MRNLKAILQEAPAIIFANLGKVLFGATVLGVIGWLGGIFHVYQTIWIFGKILLQAQTPLWATIALGLLLAVYNHEKNQTCSKTSPNKVKIDFIDDSDLKWKATLFANGNFRVEDIPFCTKHDLQLLSFTGAYLCQCAEKEECETLLLVQDYSYRKSCVESRAEQKFRNNKK